MKILVTGATGFVGKAVIRALEKVPTVEIVATSLDPEEAVKGEWSEKIRYIPLDVSNQEILEQDLFNLFGQPHILIHLAWKGLPNYDKLFHFEENLFSSYYFIRNLVTHGLKKVVAIGTCLEYGMQSGCLSEDVETKPLTPYGLAKDTLRKFLEQLRKPLPFEFNWIRLFYLHGKGQAKSSLLSQLQSALDQKKDTFNMSKGEQLRDYLSIDEAAENIVKVALQSEISGVINCCSGQPVSVRRFVEDFLKRTNQQISLNLGFYPYPNYEPMAFWGDTRKLNLARKAFANSVPE